MAFLLCIASKNQPNEPFIKFILASWAILLLIMTCSKDSNKPEPQGNTNEQSTDDPPENNTPDPPKDNIIGTQGGEVTSDDGIITLVIPSGALSEPIDINIEIIEENLKIEESDALQIGPTYRITPTDILLNKSISIEFNLPDNLLPKSMEGLVGIRAANFDNSIISKSSKISDDLELLSISVPIDSKKVIIEGIFNLGYIVLQDHYLNLFTEEEFGVNPWRNFTFKWAPSNKIITWSFVPPDDKSLSYLVVP